MNRDPLFQAILAALEKPIDPDEFQLAAQQLLRPDYPGLAIMVGGDDAGMDGAIATPQGSFPLIATVSKKVLANVRRNLTRYLSERGTLAQRRAVVATSARVTPKQRRNIEDAALQLGVVIENVHERFDIASRLYTNPTLRKALLGITGDPPALSMFPRGARSAASRLLIGRADDLQWIRAQKGDLLVLGQPGSGKTYLHQQLTLDGDAVFAIDQDRGRIADAVRHQRPKIVVVDDAHANLDVLEAVIDVRAQIDGSFAIHANAWPRMAEPVVRRLRLLDTAVHELQPLTADQIVEFVNAAGIVGPELLLHILVQQAEGKPGLAAVLVDACKTQEDLSAVWSGDVLARELVHGGRAVRDRKETVALAAFALAGDAGFKTQTVADALRISPAEVYEIAVSLSAGGLVEDMGDRRMQVRPPAIRGVLVADVFFGTGALDPTPLIAASESPESTAHVLISAATRGRVSFELIDQLIAESRTGDVWSHYSSISREAAYHVLRRYPNRVCAAAAGILHYATDDGLDALLVAETRQANGTRLDDLAAPRDRIQHWLVGDEFDQETACQRRISLMEAIERAVSDTAVVRLPPRSVAWALSVLINPRFEYSRQKAGKGDRFVFGHGIVAMDVLRTIVDLHRRTFAIVRRLPLDAVSDLFGAIEAWCFPAIYQALANAPTDVGAMMRSTGESMLKALAERPDVGVALRSRIAAIAARAGFEFPVQLDAKFELLYGDVWPHDDWARQQRETEAAIRDFADTCSRRNPADVIAELLAMETEAQALLSRAGRQQWLHHEIAAHVGNDSVRWLDALLDVRGPAEFVSAYLAATLQHSVEIAVERLRALLADEKYAQVAVAHLIRFENAPADLLADAIRLVDPDRFRSGLWPNQVIPLRNMEMLLTRAESTVRVYAALHEIASTKTYRRTALAAAVRSAILEATDEDSYHLMEILRDDSSLANDWIAAKLQQQGVRWWRLKEILSIVAKSLSTDQRRRLLAYVTTGNYSDEVMDQLVRDDVELYDEWFSRQPDRYVRLRPLNRLPSPRWERMAILALDRGATEPELAQHCHPMSAGGVGPMSEHYKAMIPIYESLLRHEDRRLHRAAQAGLEWARSGYESQIQRERQEAIRGI